MRTLNIKESSAAILVFYEVFLDYFINVDCHGVLSGNLTKYSPQTWLEKGTINKYKALEIFGGDYIKSPQYFHRLKNRTKLENPKVSVCANALGKALLHMGFSLKDEKEPSHSRAEAAQRFKLFEAAYAEHIKKVQLNAPSGKQNEISDEIRDGITTKAISGSKNEIVYQNRFQALNGKFEGHQTQGQRKDSVTLTLSTGSNNSVTGTFTVTFQKDEMHVGHTETFILTALFFSDSILRCIYCNEDLSIVQHGYIDFELSTDKNWLHGEFTGYYCIIPDSRKRDQTQHRTHAVGKLSLKRTISTTKLKEANTIAH